MTDRLPRLVIIPFLVFLLIVGGSWQRLSAASPPKIVVNQVGYLPNSSKVAFLVNSDAEITKIDLVDNTSKQIVKILPLSRSQSDPQSKDRLQTIDFSQIDRMGNYFLRAGKIVSYPFRIAADVYQEPIIKLLRSYYLQRCGVEIADRVTGIHHAPCHLRDGTIAHRDRLNSATKFIPAVGGWHDAGDYGKYVATTTVTAGRLLSLYEAYPDRFADRQLSIPESGNGIPDILDEMRVGLDWLLPMQRSDGAVYRKLSGKTWPSIVAPDADIQPRFIYGISTPETAKFAAVMAIAARVYTPWQPAQSDRYQAAIDQIDYLLGRNPFNQTFFTGIGTHPVRQTNHIFARARKINIPGLLVGGANDAAQDGIAPKHRGILSYIDDEKSYATNEYAIDYNAESIALLSMAESI
jgi:endoglucanase